jgi:RNA polymerase sigma-70 factor (ECF subfamily)
MKSLPDHFFRHEYGRLVATLTRRVGVHHLASVEDAVQFALAALVETWPKSEAPDNPSAWLFRVAQNHFTTELRRRARRTELAAQHADLLRPGSIEGPEPVLRADVQDDLLRLLFVCCHDAIAVESQLVLALKTLCGFDVGEISVRLFTSDANVYKRLARARDRLRESEFELDDVDDEEIGARLPAVQSIVYVLFTEGHLSYQADGAIRAELCDEAIRLGGILAEHPRTATPETFALLALMHLHRARLPARQTGSGGLLLLEEQDRSLWDSRRIQEGLYWLSRSAAGSVFSRYHAEAGVAAEHCLARTFAETRWDRIIACYELLDRTAPSMLHTLNRAIAMAEWRGPAEALALVEGLAPPSWLLGSHLWSAVLADLHRRSGNAVRAREYRKAAIASAPSAAVRTALERRLRTDRCRAPEAS